ncbi:MAG: hypothetical protein ACK559_34300, partial [bacterium]
MTSTGRSPSTVADSVADAVITTTAGSTAAGTPVSTSVPRSNSRANSASLTSLAAVAASAVGAAAAACAAGSDSPTPGSSAADTSGCISPNSIVGTAGCNSVNTGSTAVSSPAAGVAAAIDSSSGTGGLLPLDPAHRPEGPGTANSSSAISPSTRLPPSGAGAIGPIVGCCLEDAFFLPPFPLGSSMSFPARAKNLLPFWTVALYLLHNRPVIF